MSKPGSARVLWSERAARDGSTLQTRLGFSPDGRYLVVSGSKGTAMWALDPELWRDAACEGAGRNMTGEESQGVMGETPYRSTCLRWAPG
jgi:hypothetical protein